MGLVGVLSAATAEGRIAALRAWLAGITDRTPKGIAERPRHNRPSQALSVEAALARRAARKDENPTGL